MKYLRPNGFAICGVIFKFLAVLFRVLSTVLYVQSKRNWNNVHFIGAYLILPKIIEKYYVKKL